MATNNGGGGLTFGNLNDLRRSGGFQQQHAITSNKPAPMLPQHASTYQHQAYTTPQATGAYTQHLFQTPNAVQNLNAVQQQQQQQQQQNGSRSAAQQQQQTITPVPAPTPSRAGSGRVSNHRQMASQSTNNNLAYLQQSLNQPSLNQHTLAQHQLQQSNDLAPIGQQSMSRGHTSGAGQVLSQTSLQQQQQQQQSMSQAAGLTLQGSAPGQISQYSSPQAHNQRQSMSYTPTTQLQQEDSMQQLQETDVDDTLDVDDQLVEDDTEADATTTSQKKTKPKEGPIFVPPTPMGAMMSPPPEGGSYASLEEVHKAVMAYCTSVGYAIVIGRSKKANTGLKKVLFVCDRGGKPPNKKDAAARKRKTKSRKCDCQFGFFAAEKRTEWTVRYRPGAEHLLHNHGASESPLLHPAARKLDSKMVAAVKSLKESGVGVSRTLEILQSEHPNVPLMPRDIYNARAAITRNPQKVLDELAQDLPAIYSKAQPTQEERIRNDIRGELARAKEELEHERETNAVRVAELEQTIEAQATKLKEYEGVMKLIRQSVPGIA